MLTQLIKNYNSKKRFREIFEKHKNYVSAGKYFVEGKFAIREDAHRPQHLVSTRGHEKYDKNKLFAVLNRLTNSIVVDSDIKSGASIITTKTDRNWDILFIHPDNKSVTRHVPGMVPSNYREQRLMLEKYLSIPALYSCTRDTIVEEFIDGIALESLSIERKCEIVNELIKKYTLALSMPGLMSNSAINSDSILENSSSLLKLNCFESIDISKVFHLLAMGNLLSMGDLSSHNIVVCGNEEIVIDIAPVNLGFRPFWYDVIGLVTCGNDMDNTKLFWKGVWDEPINYLFCAAGYDTHKIKNFRKEIIAAFLVIGFLHKYPFDKNNPKKRIEYNNLENYFANKLKKKFC